MPSPVREVPLDDDVRPGVIARGTPGFSGADLMNLVNDILDFAKAEAGMIELSPEPVALSELVEQCIKMVDLKAEEARVSVTAQLAPDINEIDLRLFFEMHSDRFEFPELRRARHILIRASEDDNTQRAAARALAASVMQRIRDGEDQVEVDNGQEVMHLGIDPASTVEVLALRAVAIPAGIPMGLILMTMIAV